MIHQAPHPLARVAVRLLPGVTDPARGLVIAGAGLRVEDWWDRIAGKPWTDCDGNPACLQYAARSALAGLPLDNEVVYGKITGFGHLVHASELGPEV